ncbi:Solute carrier family 25 member 51 [Sarcoptes scabiei]|uniref:Solute carrier family 25 member 51 n=1 Tax=Sarcoptes scabiei TaxID=52283 RepID=A0A834R2B7_SARSC|nr:Solute carrier family 25 member 51 [Sarcoptes scabiei]UXI23117.1 Sars1 allergen SMIPP-C [Sarcoptes scabiei]
MNRLGLEEQKRLNSNVNTTDINTSSSKRFTFDHHRCCHSTIDYNYEDYICGFGAAIVNIYVTFPINKIIFRQMIHGQNVRTATAILRSEGIDRLYRGVAPPLIQRSLTLSLMFGTFGTYHSLLDRYADHILPSSYRFCLSAFLAGTTEAIMCPLERVQMLLQDDRLHHRYSNTIDAFKKLRAFGFYEYYRGLSAILLRNGPSNILFFTFRNEIKDRLPQPKNHPKDTVFSSMIKDFVSGSIIGAVISTVFYPLNVVRTRMQTQQPGSKHLTLFEAAIDIYHQRDKSIRKLFRGVHINYSRSFLSWGIVNSCYELFHKLFFDKKTTIS